MRIVLTNWLRYRGGPHVVELAPGAHGVVAEWGGDARRSNWAGKTSLLAAVGFALFGIVPDECTVDDDWITRGEPAGSVLLAGDGWSVERSRQRGKSTQLSARFKDGSGETASTGPEAQNLIAKRVVGLTRDEWIEACWLRQKDHAGLVGMRPGERMDRVRQWCDLGVLELAEKEARDRLSKIERELDRALQKEEDARQALERTVPGGKLDVDEARREIEASRERSAELRKVAEESIAGVRKATAAEHARRGRADQQARAERLDEEAAKLEASAKAAPPPKEGTADRVAAANALAAKTRDEEESALRLLGGSFDGRCPVNGRDCPVACEIVADKERARKRADDARAAHKRASKERDDARYAHASVEEAARNKSRLEEQASSRRTLARALRDTLGPELPAGEDPSDLEMRAQEAQRDFLAEGERRAGLERRLAQYEAASSALEKAKPEVERLDESKRLLRLAVQVLGRSGAQRALAESTVGVVEDRANAVLSRAGVPLSVSLEWGRPTQKREPECPACGHEHPSTSKASRCSGCGAERPFAMTDGLEMNLSDRSGAADDLAGVALSLAAGSVVRSRRASPWELVLVDEPFSACDEANSEALSRQLSQILGGEFGFRRSLVVAHSRRVVDGLPGKVLVEAGPDGSRVRAL